MKRPTKVPGFDGTLPTGTDKALAKRIEALTEAVDIRLGRRGDPQDRAVTLRELIESGLAEELRAEPWDPNNPRRGNIGLRPSGFADLTVPPAPTGVSATGGYSLVTVFWDFPTYLNHSLTEIWRHSADTIGDAVLVGTSGGRSFVDPVGGGVTRYYWVRHVSESSIPGPFHSTSGDPATTATDVASLLTTLNGAITTSQLVGSLVTRINLIDGSSATPGTIPYQIAAEATARAAAISAESTARATAIAAEASARTAAINAEVDVLQDQINDLVTVPTYAGGTSYVVDDLVQYSGNLYRCILATTGNLPTNATYWELLGEYSSLAEAVSDASAAIVQLNNVTASSGSANASALYALQSTVNHATTGLLATRATLASDYYTSASTDSAIASALTIYSTTAQMNTALGNYTTTANLTLNYYTKSGADAAIASALTIYTTTTALNTALSAYTTTASLTSNYYTRTNTDSAIATALTTYVSTTALNTALTAYTTTASLTSNYYTQTQTDNAIAGALTTYVTTTALTTALGSYTTTASLTTNYYTRTNTDDAIAAALTTYTTTTALNTALSAYTNTATLTTNYYTRTATDSAISTAVTGLASTSYVTTQLSAYTTTAILNTDYYTKTQADSAISVAVSGLASTTYVTTQLGSYVTNATLTTNYSTTTAMNSAISSATSTLASTSYVTTALGSYTTTAALEINYYTKAQGLLLEAQYMVKLDVNGRVSGFGLYSSATASEFIILADRFAIVSQYNNGVVATPFIVQATGTTIGGVSVPAGIYVSDAFIMNGTINNAKIANAAIDDAKIANLSANKITTGTLDTSRLNIDGATLIAEDGVLKIGFLDVDNLTAGSITADKIVGGAINSIAISEVSVANALPTNATYEAVNSLVFLKERGTDSYLTIDFEIDVTATGGGAYALLVRIKRDGAVVSKVFSFYMTRSFAETVQGRCRIIGAGASTSTYELEVQNNISGAGFATATVNNSALTITEVKR
jgi:hypothetical protein